MELRCSFVLTVVLSTFFAAESRAEGLLSSLAGGGKQLTKVITNPDASFEASEYIKSRNFVPETHTITTKDGYILTMFRVMNPKADESTHNKPVLLQHGLFGSCFDWLINSRGGNARTPTKPWTYKEDGNNLAFELANIGYDVWLMNSRGSFYSINHTKWDPDKDDEFWQYSYDQMAEYDEPTALDYIMKNTGTKTVSFVGHSQGTILMFAMLASVPKYNEIVKPFVALSPAARTAAFGPITKALTKDGIARMMKNSGPIAMRPKKGKIKNDYQQSTCMYTMTMLFAVSMNQVNPERLMVYCAHFPMGSSYWNLAHMLQSAESRSFSRFNYMDEERNMKKYGQKTPPKYDLGKITNKNIALIYSKSDSVTTHADVKWLKAQLKVPLLMDHNVPVKGFQHGDFILGKDSGRYANARVVEALNLALWKDKITPAKAETADKKNENNLDNVPGLEGLTGGFKGSGGETDQPGVPDAPDAPEAPDLPDAPKSVDEEDEQ